MHSGFVSDLYQGGIGEATQLGVYVDGRRICRVYAESIEFRSRVSNFRPQIWNTEPFEEVQ